ncbi:MAG: hypothetical protein Q4C49_09955 [Bacillota bacterium]|nr:hypothetical protein [Bacillota bacterium]
MNKNGFTLLDCLLGLLILILCIQTLTGVVNIVYSKGGIYIDTEIQKEWFYAD